MLRGSFILAAILALPGVMLAAQETAPSADKQLASQLTQAAHSGDVNAFLALLSSDTRRAMTDAATAQSKLVAAQKDFYAAAAERFGASRGGGGALFPVKDAAAELSRFANIEVTGAQRQTSSRMLLQLKTTVKEPDGPTTTSEDNVPAVLENGKWKLDLAAQYRGVASSETQKAAAYVAVTQQLRSGAFKDPASATVAMVKAWRGLAAEGASK